MKIDESFPEIFRRPVPAVMEGTLILVGGTLLDTPRRDVMPIVRSSDMTFLRMSKDTRCVMAFGGHAILSGLLECEPRNHYKFLFEPIENIAIPVRPIPTEEDISTLLDEFARTRFGWEIVEAHGLHSIVTLADVIPLYRRGVLDTSLRVKDVASKVFELPKNTKLSKVLLEMMTRSMRRIFISGTNKFVSDREILAHIFSPTRLAVVKRSPKELLESTLGDVDSVEPILVRGDATLQEVSELFKPASGGWCLICEEGVVTPWDLVMKPWKMESLEIRDGLEKDLSQTLT
ncbi:MAG: hypothetical protein JRN52_01495 [Nitrososphaerota archaeon]|nr:hypothetical protein [Nitrososphaerota archaeon]